MALINSVTGQAPDSSTNTPVLRPVRINEGRPESKLCEGILRHLALEVFERPLKDRENAIQGYRLSYNLVMMLDEIVKTLTTLENKLREVYLHKQLLDVLQEIRDLCSVKEAGREELTYLPNRFNAYFKPMIEKIAATKNETISFAVFQSQDPSFKEILGLWYVCKINNEKDLTSFLQTQTYITKVRVMYNIGPAGVEALAGALKVNRTLTYLDFEVGEIIEDAGAIALAEALKGNTTLTSLVLTWNKIGAKGAEALAEALKVNRVLTSVNLWGNQIGDAGAIALAEALKVNRALTGLDFGVNDIGDAGAIALAEALKENTSLRNLDLGRNRIGAEGAKALAEALKVNRTLTSFNLWDNQIGDEGAQAFAEALKENITLTILNLKDNQFGAASKRALREIVASRPGLKINF